MKYFIFHFLEKGVIIAILAINFQMRFAFPPFFWQPKFFENFLPLEKPLELRFISSKKKWNWFFSERSHSFFSLNKIEKNNKSTTDPTFNPMMDRLLSLENNRSSCSCSCCCSSSYINFESRENKTTMILY